MGASDRQGELFTPPLFDAVSARPTVTLIDVSGLVFRAYHALPPLTTSRGEPTQAVLGFTRMLLKLLRERNPTHVALCFDKNSREGRLAIDPNYKATRSAAPPDLAGQFEWVRKVVDALGLRSFEVSGWEADDVIATLTAKAGAAGAEVEILTSDKDFVQLLGPGVHLYDPMKEHALTPEEVRTRYGVAPSQWCDYQALIGDTVDNIPKVPGVGAKTAARLLEKYGTLGELYAHLDEVPDAKLRTALFAHREQVARAHSLATFKRDLPVDYQTDDLERRPQPLGDLRNLLAQLEFFRLVDELPGSADARAAVSTPTHIIADGAGVATWVAGLAKQARLALVPVHAGDPRTSRLAGLAISTGPSDCVFLDAGALSSAEFTSQLAPEFHRRSVDCHESKPLHHLLHGVGGIRPGADLTLLAYLCNPVKKANPLWDMARERLGRELPEVPSATAAPQEMADAFGSYALAVWELAPKLWAEAEVKGVAQLAREVEIPLALVLAKMERVGIAVDLNSLDRVATDVRTAIASELERVYQLAGREFNVGSPTQLAAVLYQDLKLPVLKRNKTGPSTEHDILERLADDHPLPAAVIEYRNVARLKSAYLDPLPSLVTSDGRVHTTIHQTLAATGRLSSTDPNLQSLPVRTELGRRIRSAFVARPGHRLISADYSQIELRILAHLSGDESLLAAFASGDDVHALTAALVFGIAASEATSEQRRAAKMVNYGIAYGLSAHGLAMRLKISRDEAAGIIAAYFQRFPGIARYMADTLTMAKEKGYVVTLYGRRRDVPEVHSKNRAVASAAERAAINLPIQGTAADLAKRAMLRLDAVLPPTAALLMQVHDELLLEAPEADAAKVAELAVAAMAGAGELRVPLVVDCQVGFSWADVH